MNKRLIKGDNKIIGGVYSGIAEYLDLDPTLIRIVWLLLIFTYGIGIIPYFLCWLIIPNN